MQQDGVYYTAVLNPDGTYGLVLQNDTDAEVDIRVSADEQTFNCKVPSKSVSSFIW
jgi:O-glycosyl hydrolase